MAERIDDNEAYVSPLATRYASPEMARVFGSDWKYGLWRRLWVALAEAQKELGLDITQEQVDELKAAVDDIDYAVVSDEEQRTRHDVMSHLHAFALKCPTAKPILHLGATSAFVQDNADLILIREAMLYVMMRLVNCIEALSTFALEHKNLPALGMTHFQPAQITTVGKRACLWLQDLLFDLEEIERLIVWLPFRGVKGTTGTQASFLALFNGDAEKVAKLDALVTDKMGFSRSLPICGQTYTRKIDSRVLSMLAGVAESAAKFANDIRLLQGLGEMEEPFEKDQVGSSAMAYKRNPMRAERINGLSRFVISLEANGRMTSSAQWLERTLDDSANRRLTLPEAFMATDAVLRLVQSVASGLVVYPQVIAHRLDQQLPFMATENILMVAVKKGGDRQDLHERIRTHAMKAAEQVKELGNANDLLDRLAADPAFAQVKKDLPGMVDPVKFVGLAPTQVQQFVTGPIAEMIARHQKLLGKSVELHV